MGILGIWYLSETSGWLKPIPAAVFFFGTGISAAPLFYKFWFKRND
jgi:hypothetical protein